MAVWGGTGAGWGYLILNLILVLAVADAMVGALAAMFTMCSNNWRTAGESSLTGHTPALLFAAHHGPALTQPHSHWPYTCSAVCCISWTCFDVYLMQPQLPAPAYNACMLNCLSCSLHSHVIACDFLPQRLQSLICIVDS